MQLYNTFQNTALLFLRIVTASLFYVAAYYKFPFCSGAPGWNFPLAVLAGCLILLAFGTGRWSVDGRKNKNV